MTDNGCEGFEIAIEMRRHGAANAETSRRLDAHLQGCASCRAFESLGAETETRLRVDAEEAQGKVDLERLRARGRRVLRGHWTDYGVFFLLLALAFAVRVILKVTGLEQGNLGLDPVLAIVAFVSPFVAMRRSRRELNEAWSSDVLFHTLRKYVNERLTAAFVLSVVGIALSISFFVDRQSGGGAFPAGVARAIFVGCFGALGLFVLIVRVPRLLRERQEIPLVADPYATLGLS